MNATVGDKVVCVDVRPCSWCGNEVGLTKDAVYVVAGVRTCGKEGTTIYDLVGNVADCHVSPYGPVGHGAVRFRKLDELKQERRIANESND